MNQPPAGVPPRSWRAFRHLQMPALSVSSALISRSSLYVVLILLARLLTPVDFGAFALLTVLIGVIVAIASGGGDMWLNRFTWHRASKARRAPRVWRVYLLACLSAAAAVLVVSLAGAAWYGQEYALAAALAFFAATVLGLAEALLAILRASNMLTSFFLLRDIVGPLGFVGLIALLRPSTLEAAFAIQLAVNAFLLLCAGMVMLLNAGTLLPVVPPRRCALRWVARHTAGLMVGNLSSRMAAYADILVMGFFVSLTDVGEYRVAAQVAIGFTIVQHFFFLGLPWQIRHVGQEHAKGLGFAGVLERQRLLLVLSLLGLVALCLAADPILSVLGERFRNVGMIFRLLLMLRFVELLWGPQHEILISNGRLANDVLSNVVSLAGWSAIFLVSQRYLPQLHAAVLANVLSSAGRHFYLHVVMVRLQLARPFGHPFGATLPLVLHGLLSLFVLRGL